MIACAVAGCGSQGSSDGTPDPAAGSSGGQSAPGFDLSGRPTLYGTYELSSFLDLTSAGVMPDALNNTLAALAQLDTNPAEALLQLLAATDVPIAGTVVKWLPPTLRNAFDGWFNGYVFQRVVDNVPGAQALANLTSDLAGIATHFEVVSRLDFPAGDAVGDALGTHVLTGVAFNVRGKRYVVDAPDLLQKTETANGVPVNAVHILEQAPKLEDGRIDLGAHSFGVPFGQYALRAMDQYVQDQLKVPSLRQALGNVFDCPGLAKHVVSSCSLPCTGKENDVRAVCESGLDAVVEELQMALNLFNLKSLSFTSGSAKMWDPPVDGAARDKLVDRIDHGNWTCNLAATTGPEHAVSATFVGHRVGGAAPASGGGGGPAIK